MLHMNKNQLIAMWIGIALFILMGLFPPFIDCRLADDGIYKFRGFHFYLTSRIKVRTEKSIAQPQGGLLVLSLILPGDNVYEYRTYHVKIDYYRLRHQWLLLVVLTAGIIITAGQRGKPVKSKRPEE